MHYFPIFLDLRHRPCLVVGGGIVGSRKVESLLNASAKVTVISPQASGLIREHARNGRLQYHSRPYRQGDLKGYFLAFAATGTEEVDRLMARDANAHGVLLNVVDQISLCTFITPAVVQRGDLTIAVSTGGKCPGFAKQVKQRIEELIHAAYGPALAGVARNRQALLRDSTSTVAVRRERLENILNSAFDEIDSEVR